jgi:hypothetical protein
MGGLLGSRSLRGIQSQFGTTASSLYGLLQSTAASRGISGKSFAELAGKLGLNNRVVRLVNALEHGNVSQDALNALSGRGMGRLVQDLAPLGISRRELGARLTTPDLEGQGLFMQHGGTQAALGAQHAYVNQRVLQPAIKTMLSQGGHNPKGAQQVLQAFMGFKGRGVRTPQEAEFLARRMGMGRGMGNRMYQTMTRAVANPRLKMVTGGSMRNYMDLYNAQSQARPMMARAKAYQDVMDPLIKKHRLNMPWQARAFEDLATPGGPKGFMNLARSIAGVVPKEELMPIMKQLKGIQYPGQGQPAQSTPMPSTAPTPTPKPGGWRSIMQRSQGVTPSSRGGFNLPS